MADGDATGDAASKTDDSGKKGTDKGQDTVTFNEKQQAIIQNLIDERYTKAYDKAKAESDKQTNELKKQIESLSKGKKESAQSGDKGKFTADEVESKISEIKKAAEQQIEAANKNYASILNRSLKAEIIDAATTADCVSPKELAEVLIAQGAVKLDDEGSYEINPPEGITKIGDDGKPISLAVFVERFVSKNLHWKRSNVGQGGTGSVDGDDAGKPKLLSQMTEEEVGKLSEAEFSKLDAEQNLSVAANWYETETKDK